MHEWSSVVVSSFGWWSRHAGALESNGMCSIQTFTMQTLIVGLPSSDIHVIHSFTFCLLYMFSPYPVYQYTFSFSYKICPFSGNLQNWLDREWTPTAEDEQWRKHDAPESVTEHPAPHQHTSPPAELREHSTTVQDLSMSTRTRRDVGPAGVCCTSGCTMSELIQYC